MPTRKASNWRATFASEVPDRLVGDPMRLRQILINLIDNAIKFTEHGSVLLKVAVEGNSNGRQGLHFSVKDTGTGIPPEKQAMIFEAFAQVDGSTTRNYGGTGLGLAIAAQLVEQMRGKIWIDSGLDQGTIFHFTAWFGLAPASAPLTVTPNVRVPHSAESLLYGFRRAADLCHRRPARPPGRRQCDQSCPGVWYPRKARTHRRPCR